MAKREQFRLPGGIPIETGVDNGQRWFVGYRKGSSMGFTCPKELRRWLKLPLKTPSREAFDAWVATLEEAEAHFGQSLLMTTGAVSGRGDEP